MKSAIRKWVRHALVVALAASGCSAIVAQEDAEEPTLTIGSQAPQLDIEHWISDGKGRFKPVTKFEKDHIYIVEFWATWCGPCVAGMPHLAELQAKYADKNVQVIGVSDEDMPTVEEFLEGHIESDKDNPTYAELTSAYCLATDPDRSVYDDYMSAAGQNGIPNAFIVGKSGIIEWVGHPMAMDDALQQVVDDKWDRNVYLAEFKAEQERDFLRAKVVNLAGSGKVDEALAFIAKKKIEAKDDAAMTEMLEGLEFRVKLSTIARKLQRGGDLDEVLKELETLASQGTPEQQAQIEVGKIQLLLQKAISDSKYVEPAVASLNALAEKKDVDHEVLNMCAWTIYEASQAKEDFPKELIAAATKAAERGVKEAPEDPAMIDTLSHLVYVQGDVDRAIKLQTDAVNKADGEMKSALQKFLDKLTAEKKSKD